MDCGNGNVADGSASCVVRALRKYTRPDKPMNKCAACEYVGLRRSAFDDKVRKGLIPRGMKIAGLRELLWYRKDLDKYLENKKK